MELKIGAVPEPSREGALQKGTEVARHPVMFGTRPVPRAVIRQLEERIAREFRPERIMLFGSYTRGEPGPDSDVDLLVVLPFEGKPWRMATAILNRRQSQTYDA